MKSKEKGNIIFIRLYPNENLNEEIKKVCFNYNIKTAIVISGIGQLKNFQLGYFKEKGNYAPKKFNKPYELLSLNGNICKKNEDYLLHFHAVLADDKKNVVGGHLLEGIVEITNEIVILKSNISIDREIEKTTGLQELILE